MAAHQNADSDSYSLVNIATDSISLGCHCLEDLCIYGGTMNMTWQSVGTAPKDGTEFQGWLITAGASWWEPRCRFNNDGAFEIWGRIDWDEEGFDTVNATLTHWMPQPGPPL